MTGHTLTESAENAPIEELLCEDPDVTHTKLTKPSSNDSGFDEEVVIKDEQARGIESCGSNSSECQEPHDVSMMIYITEENCWLTLKENGTVQHSMCIPLKLGIVRHKVLVFGDEVSSYERAASDKAEFLKNHFYSFKLGKCLLESEARPLKFIFDGGVVHGKIELLMGLFFSYLKDIVRSFVPKVNSQINKTFILVPNSFTSFHRQRLKDSAHIAGINKIFIVSGNDDRFLVDLAARKHVPGKSVTDLASLPKTEVSNTIDELCVDLYQTQTVSGRYRLRVTGKVSKDVNGNFVSYLGYPMERTSFYQKNALGEQWDVGTLHIMPLFHYDHCLSPNIEIHMSQSQDGIFSLDSVDVYNATTNLKRTLNSEFGEYVWLPANLGLREKKEFEVKLREIRGCSVTYQVDRSRSEKKLREIWSDMSERLWSGNHIKIRRERKMDIELKVETVSRMFNKIHSSQLMEVGRKELQRNLKELKLEYEKFFKRTS